MLIAIFSILFCVYLFFGLYVLSINWKKNSNQLFFLITICLALNCLGGIFIQTSQTNELSIFWFKFCIVFYMIHWFLILVLYIYISKINLEKSYLYFILFIPACYSILKILQSHEPAIFIINNNTRYISDYGASINDVYQSYIISFLYFLASILILLKGYRITNQNKTKKQFIIISISQFTSFTLVTIDHILLFQLLNISTSRIPAIIMVYSLIWIFGIWYTIIKYKFLRLTPKMITDEIINDIDESIILIDQKLKILFINNPTLKILHEEFNKLLGVHISHIINNHNEIIREINKLINAEFNSFSCRLKYKNLKSENSIFMDSKFSLIKDKYNDIFGVLIISREVKELRQLKSDFKISNRETEVIQHIINGETNQEIAEKLYISERTVKAHNKNIFNKLKVENRIQLLMLLKEFNLIPNITSEKIILIPDN